MKKAIGIAFIAIGTVQPLFAAYRYIWFGVAMEFQRGFLLAVVSLFMALVGGALFMAEEPFDL